MDFLKSIVSTVSMLFVSLFPSVNSTTTNVPLPENKDVEVVSIVATNTKSEGKKIVITTKAKPAQAPTPIPKPTPEVVPVITPTVDPLPNNQTALPLSVPDPVVDTTPTQTIVIVEQQQAPAEQTAQMASTAPTYTVMKGGNTILSKAPIGEVRALVSNLNNYVSWKNKVKTATVKELADMLVANGYEIDPAE